AVVFGGPSREHEVSRWSGEQVLRHLDRDRYRALAVLIERDRSWIVEGERMGGPIEGALALRRAGCDVAFLATHGPFGEDGTLQGFLETVGLPFTGSGVAGSALARNKIHAKRLVAAAGIGVAPDLTLPPADAREVSRRLGFPVVVKNPHEGSTLGLCFAADEAGLLAAIEQLGGTCPALLVERREQGRELTAGVLEDASGVVETLPLVEIRTRGEFDFRAKYTPGGAEEICPAPLDEGVAASIRATAADVHRLLGLRGMSRSDFILRPDGGFVYLETNTIPGLTGTSLLPAAAAAAGVPFRELLTRLVEGALRPRNGR
ncbi:MAG: D-alanine--D-alanine ligase family protein, partial [Planctomycetota bacterium]